MIGRGFRMNWPVLLMLLAATFVLIALAQLEVEVDCAYVFPKSYSLLVRVKAAGLRLERRYPRFPKTRGRRRGGGRPTPRRPTPRDWLVRAARYRRFAGALTGSLSYLTCHMFFPVLEFRMRFGLLDAAVTGMTAGLAWAAGGCGLLWLRRRLRLARGQPVLALDPAFTANAFEARLRCIFRMRIGHIMVATAKAGVAAVMIAMRDRLERSRRTWRNTRSSAL
jgi:hypothetical protein